MKVGDQRLNWEGLAAGGGLLLPLDHGCWPLIDTGVVLDGVHFRPKRELHVTLLTRAQARAVAERGLDADALLPMAADIDWQWRATREAWRLRRVRDGADAQSLMVRIEQPGQVRLRQRIHEVSGLELGVPVPHVTLYTHGDPSGISVPDAAVFESLQMARVDPALLSKETMAGG